MRKHPAGTQETNANIRGIIYYKPGSHRHRHRHNVVSLPVHFIYSVCVKVAEGQSAEALSL